MRGRLGTLGECEENCSTAVGPAVRPDPAAMARNDAVHYGESYTGPGKRLLLVQPLKDAEQLLRITHVEPDAIVAHKVNRLVCLAQHADLDARRVAPGGE